MHRQGRSRLVAVGCLINAATGFGGGISHAAPDRSGCQSVSAPMVDIPGGDSEPRLRIPLPSGWEVSPALSPTDASIRLAILNPALADSGFTPNAVAVLKKVDPRSGDALQILELQNEILRTKTDVTELNSMSSEVCGLPAMSATYTAQATGGAPPRKVTSLIVVDESDEATYIASVTIQSADHADETYARDSQIILDGFQVIPNS